MWLRLPGWADTRRTGANARAALVDPDPIEKMEELDTAAIPPTAQTIELADVFRDDVAARPSRSNRC